MKTKDKIFNPAYAALIFIFAFIIYSNSIGNFFVRDDSAQISNNPWIKSFSGIGKIFLSNVWAFTGRPSNYYRPIMYLGYMIVYKFFGMHTWGYHLVSVLLHAANSVLVYAAACIVLRRTTGIQDAGARIGALASGLVFAAHPVHVEAVAWAGGYPDLTATLFSLLAFLVFARYADQSGAGQPSFFKYFSLEFLFLLGALLSKEAAAGIPFVLVAYDLFLSGRRKGVIKRYAPLFCALLVYAGMRSYAIFYGPAGWLAGGFLPAGASIGIAGVNYHPEISQATGFLTAVSFFARYLYKIFTPVRLNSAYGYQPVSSVDWPFAISAAVAALFAVFLYISFRKDRRYFFAGMFFLLPLAPSLYVSHGLGQFIFAERYLYIPSVGFSLAAGLVMEGFLSRGKAAKNTAAVLFAALIVFYGVSSFERNHVWKDDYSVWSDAALKTPDNAYVQCYYGIELEHKGRLDEAIAAFRTAASLQPDYMKAYSEWGGALMEKGDNEKAVQVLQTALSIDDASPDSTGIHYRLARAYLALGNPQAAIGEYRTVLARISSPALSRELAALLCRAGDTAEAEELYKRALIMDPAHAGPTNCRDMR